MGLLNLCCSVQDAGAIRGLSGRRWRALNEMYPDYFDAMDRSIVWSRAMRQSGSRFGNRFLIFPDGFSPSGSSSGGALGAEIHALGEIGNRLLVSGCVAGISEWG